MTQIISAYEKGIDAIVNKKSYDGIFIVSPGYPLFESRSLEEYTEKYLEKKRIDVFTEFGLEYFNNFSVFINDGLLKYNLMAFENMSEYEALKESDLVGKYSKEICSSIVNKISNKIKVNSWNDFDFEKELLECRNLANKNERFKEQCLDITRNGTKNRLKYIKQNYGKKKYEEARDMAGQYAIDGIASQLFFHKQEIITLCKYETYPIIKDINTNNYPKLKEELCLKDKIGHIQIKVDDQKIQRRLYDDEYKKIT